MPNSGNSAATEPPRVTVARIEKPQGRRGEVSCEMLSDFADRFAPGSEFFLSEEGGEPRRVRVESSWFHKGKVILKLSGINTISDAKAVAGWLLSIPRDRRHSLPPHTAYVDELTGCSVVADGNRIGVVSDLDTSGAAPLLKLDSPQGEILIPFAQEFLQRIDVEKREIVMRLPEGLVELNRAPERQSSPDASAPQPASPRRSAKRFAHKGCRRRS